MRHAENLAVLGGAISRRQWSRPVSLTEVLRSSIAEVEQYPRIKLVPPIEGTLRGHAVADVIHLLAELVENATIYSAPQTPVLLRAQLVTAGLAVEVEDRGLGMSADEQSRMNGLLADPEHIDVAELLSDGRIGLFVVSSPPAGDGIVVRLQSNIYGGVQAVLIVPQALLGAESADGDANAAGAPHTGAPDTAPARAYDASDHGTYEAGGYSGGHDSGQERHDRHDPAPAIPHTLAIPAPGPAPDHAPALSPHGHDGRADPAPVDTDPDLGATRRRLRSARPASTLPASTCPRRTATRPQSPGPRPPTGPARSCCRPLRPPWTTPPARGCPGVASRRISCPSCAVSRSCRPAHPVPARNPSTTPA